MFYLKYFCLQLTSEFQKQSIQLIFCIWQNLLWICNIHRYRLLGLPVELQTKLHSDPMALIQVSQISFESEVCGVKWQHFYDKVVNK